MRNSLLFILCLALAACATAPRTTVMVPLPCPEKPTLERPVLETIPAGAAVDYAAVIIKRNTLKLMAYAAEASKQEGCSKR